MDKNQMVAKLNELQHLLRQAVDPVKIEELKLGIKALERALAGKIRTQNDALRGGETE